MGNRTRQNSYSRESTIDQVAELAGVSRATVSRVINSSATVSKETEKVVRAAIRKLNFTPNSVARKLAGGRSGLIALVIEETNEEFFANSFWAEVVQGFSSVISEAGLHPLMLIRQKNSTEESLFATLQAGQMDALAIFGWHKPIKVLENLLVPDLSVVFGGDFGGSKKYPFVDVDNLKGGFIATKHLIDSGCKKIAIITGDLTLQSSRDRLSGYEEALAKFGVKFEEQLLVHGDFTQTTAEKLVRALIKSKVKFDGIFASNDLMARGAIKELIAHGIQVPKEVKVVGFDDSRIAADNEIPITSIKQPIRELGTEVALSLLSSLNGEKVHNKLLDVKLIKRKSSTTGQN